MKPKIFADLHNHTTASDGDFTPERLVKKAQENAIPTIGVTDHDTLAGLPEAVAAGKKYQVNVIPGVEVSIRFKRSYFTGTLHLLCYFLPERLHDPNFMNEFNAILASGRGEGLVRARINEINKVFGPAGESALLERDMVFEDISSLSSNATRRHFAIALEKAFKISDPATINRVIGNSSPAYLPSGIDLYAMAGFIKTYPMVTALAHPAAGSFPGEGHYKEVLPPLEIVERIFPDFIDLGINALEVFYPGHIKEHQDLMEAWAEKYGLVMTGGSDCHDDGDRPFGVKGLTEQAFCRFKEAL